jgi:hypothetical protein
MKTARDPAPFYDFILPMEMWGEVLKHVHDWPRWLAAVTCAQLPWRTHGGLVSMVESYAKRVGSTSSTAFWDWPQPVIRASTYFPQAVFDDLRALPWLARMRDHRDETEIMGKMQVAGGYVRVEFMRALRRHCPGVVHWSLKQPERAGDIDVWVHAPTHRTLQVMADLVGVPHLDPKKASTHSAWPMYCEPMGMNVEWVLPVSAYMEGGSVGRIDRWAKDDGDEDMLHYRPNTQSVQLCLIEGFDLTCCQFAFRRDLSGDVLTTPMALYSLMTGRLVPNLIHRLGIRNQCKRIMKRETEGFRSEDRIIRRLGKYMDTYGYTLHLWNEPDPAGLTQQIREACARIAGSSAQDTQATTYEEAIYNWKETLEVCEELRKESKIKSPLV